MKDNQPENDREKESLERLMRLQADFENATKRLHKERAEIITYATQDLICQLLPIIDNFHHAIITIKDALDTESIKRGLLLIQKEFEDILTKNGLTRIKSIGEKFDPHLHEAIEYIETEEHPEGVVIEEIRPGYMLNERLIRPAVVGVSKMKPKLTE